MRSLVYKVMKKVGLITEATAVHPEKPKFYPLLSDKFFKGSIVLENRKKGYTGIKGGTKAAATEEKRRKKILQDEEANGKGNGKKLTKRNPKPPTSRNLPEPSAKDKFTNPFVNDSNSGEFQGQRDTKTPTRGGTEEERKERGGRGYMGQAKRTKPRSKAEIAKLNKPREGQMSDLDIKSQEGDPKAKRRLKKIEKVKTEDGSIATAAGSGLHREGEKDDKWIQGANADIKRRGTKGKCTPITKPGCTGKAKALAKTFKKMAKKRDAETVSKDERKKKVDEGADWKEKLGSHQSGDETPVAKDARLRKRAEKGGKKADTQGPQGNARTRRLAGEKL